MLTKLFTYFPTVIQYFDIPSHVVTFFFKYKKLFYLLLENVFLKNFINCLPDFSIVG